MKKGIRYTASRSLPLLLSAAMALIVLFTDAYNGSNLDPVPDAVEYAYGGYNLADSGSYHIVVDGRRLPPRYSPWFSITTIAPAYLILGNEPGNAIYPITLWALAGVFAAFGLGSRVSGPWSGALAAFLLLSLPSYQHFGRHVMTDVPCTALTLLACLVYIRLSASNRESAPLNALAGVICALSAAYRPASAALLLPFLIPLFNLPRKRQILMNMAALMIPMFTVAAATMLYNALTFGSPFRNGYHFWCAVPYDYFRLTFNLSYVPANFKLLIDSSLILLILAAALFCFARWLRVPVTRTSLPHSNPTACIFRFLVVGTIPTVVFHLFYFYHDERFFLPFLAMLAAATGVLAGEWLQRLPEKMIPAVQLAILLLLGTLRFTSGPDIPHRRRETDRIMRCTPDNAVIVSAIDPAYMEFLVCGKSGRRAIPLTRNVEYASKLLSAKKVRQPHPPPVAWNDHRCEGLINGGSAEAITVVASEQPDTLQAEMDKGNRVYLYTGMISHDDALAAITLQSTFTAVPRAELLYELFPGSEVTGQDAPDQLPAAQR